MNELRNRCNSNCIFCANSKMERKRANINENLIKKVLIEAFALGMREVGFYTTGESLLNSNLSQYIKLSKEIGYEYIYITTNGILMGPNKIEEIINSGIDSIKFSINAINKQDYNFIHGVNCFEKVMENLRLLKKYREENKLNYKIFVSYIATRYTDYSTDKIKNTFNKYCDDVVVVNVRNQSGMMPEINKYLSCETGENKVPANRTLPCHYVFNSVNVSCEGFLTACCTDFENYLAYADLNKVSLSEAWHNNVITSLRKMHINNDLGNTICKNCICSVESMPTPLVSEYASKISKTIFLDNNVSKRIKKYKNMRN